MAASPPPTTWSMDDMDTPPAEVTWSAGALEQQNVPSVSPFGFTSQDFLAEIERIERRNHAIAVVCLVLVIIALIAVIVFIVLQVG